MTNEQKEITLNDVTFYDFPWGSPTTAVVEYGKIYDIREGWGTREGWANDYIAIPFSDEEVERYGENLLEMSDEEVREAFSEETLQGILASLNHPREIEGA